MQNVLGNHNIFFWLCASNKDKWNERQKCHLCIFTSECFSWVKRIHTDEMILFIFILVYSNLICPCLCYYCHPNCFSRRDCISIFVGSCRDLLHPPQPHPHRNRSQEPLSDVLSYCYCCTMQCRRSESSNFSSVALIMGLLGHYFVL